MGKKKFTTKLDSLFDASESKEEVIVVREKASRVEDKSAARPARRSSFQGRKRFTSDLDSLFETVLTAEKEEREKPVKEEGRRRRSRTVRGLNALIRKTSDPDLVIEEDDSRRVTFSYKRSSYRKIKKIAAAKGAFLREVIGEVLDDFIKSYEKDNGPLD